MSRRARKQILARVRAALGDVRSGIDDDYAQVPREYQRVSSADREAALALLTERLLDYGSVVHRCSMDQVAQKVGECLLARGGDRYFAPYDFPEDWRPLAPRLTDANQASVDELNACDGVVTGCAGAIAETGTILLDGGATQGRRAVTLVPDYHLCILRAGEVAFTVPEALGCLKIAPGSAITLISGPSATSDIEMTRIQGVHGPRTLEVIVAG